MKFDPFQSRLSRDIRNAIGHAFVRSLHEHSDIPFKTAARTFLKDEQLPQLMKNHILHRETSLMELHEEIRLLPENQSLFWETARLLWNRQLFFEVHEWLEEKWQEASGDEKKALQALILSAITYEHITYGNWPAAGKVAEKALRLMQKFKDALPAVFDNRLISEKLASLDPVPPQF